MKSELFLNKLSGNHLHYEFDAKVVFNQGVNSRYFELTAKKGVSSNIVDSLIQPAVHISTSTHGKILFMIILFCAQDAITVNQNFAMCNPG